MHNNGLIIAIKPDTYYNDYTNIQRQRAQIGGKANIVSWISYTSLIWTLKGCMVFLYYRLTLVLPFLCASESEVPNIYWRFIGHPISAGLKARKFVHITTGVIVASYFGLVLMILLNCRPLSKNWTSPYGTECKWREPWSSAASFILTKRLTAW